MSKVSEVYDNMIARLAAVLPQHNRLAIPSVVEVNPEPFLRQGYGVKLGQGRNTERYIDSHMSTARSLTVVLTREAVMLANDPEGFAAAEKALLEDAVLVQKDFESHETLNSNFISNTKYVNDSGVDMIASLEGSGVFLVCEVTFETEYFDESL